MKYLKVTITHPWVVPPGGSKYQGHHQAWLNFAMTTRGRLPSTSGIRGYLGTSLLQAYRDSSRLGRKKGSAELELGASASSHPEEAPAKR